MFGSQPGHHTHGPPVNSPNHFGTVTDNRGLLSQCNRMRNLTNDARISPLELMPYKQVAFTPETKVSSDWREVRLGVDCPTRLADRSKGGND